MSADASLDDCGCGTGVTAETPVAIDNRPGLPAIACRTGTHATFLRSMLAGLSDAARPGLAGLQTRDPADFSIALLDAFATVADVLTFYQERIANESYLRTAVERASMVELCRTLGYALRPGVAASTDLAFTMETAVGAPTEVDVPVGTRVQSIPGPGQTPQTYETVEDLDARVAWNALRPRQTQPQALGASSTEVYLQGVATGLKPGDTLLFVGDWASDKTRWSLRQLTTVEIQPGASPAAARTRVAWTDALGVDPPAGGALQVFALRQRAAVFGANAPDWRAMAESVRATYLGLPDGAPQPVLNDWPGLTLVGTGLYAEYFNDPGDNHLVGPPALSRIDPGVDFYWAFGSPDPAIGADGFSARWTGTVRPPLTGDYVFVTSSDDGVNLWVNGTSVISKNSSFTG